MQSAASASLSSGRRRYFAELLFDIKRHLYVKALTFEIGEYLGGRFLTKLALGRQLKAQGEFRPPQFAPDRLGQTFQTILFGEIDIQAGAAGTSIDVGMHVAGV